MELGRPGPSEHRWGGLLAWRDGQGSFGGGLENSALALCVCGYFLQNTFMTQNCEIKSEVVLVPLEVSAPALHLFQGLEPPGLGEGVLAQGMGWNKMSFKGPFQPKPSCASMTPLIVGIL